MPLVVQSVDENSLAQRLGLGNGCLLMAIDGNPLCDALDYQFYTASERFTLTVCEGGKQRDIPVEKDQYEPFGCNFKTYLADEKHSCDNHCMFCFIDSCPRVCVRPFISRMMMSGCPFCTATISP